MKKVWIIAILILTILLLGIGIWWLVQAANQQSSQVNNRPSPTPTPVSFTDDVKLYMIAFEDGGVKGEPIGCNDSAVEVIHTVTKTDILAGTYEDLLALTEQMYGESGLYNTLAKSDLTLSSAGVDGNGVANIALSGKLVLGGECDSPRVQVQLEKPAKQFPGVNSVNVTINGAPLSALLSTQ